MSCPILSFIAIYTFPHKCAFFAHRKQYIVAKLYSIDMEKEAWMEFPAKMDSRGRVQVPKDLQKYFAGAELAVRIARIENAKIVESR